MIWKEKEKMNKSRNLIILSTLLALAGCGSIDNNQNKNMNENGTEAGSSNKDQEIKTVMVVVEKNKHYTTLKELKKDAPIILEGTIIKQETIVHGDLPFTISQIEVRDSLKGKIEKNSMIKIIETGGIYKPNGKPGEDLPLVNLQLEGGITVKEGEDFFFFLEPFVGPQVENAFIPLAIHQGKIKIDKDSKKVVQSGSEKFSDFRNETAQVFRKRLLKE